MAAEAQTEAAPAAGSGLLDRLREARPGSDVLMALGVGLLVVILVVPLPTLLLDFGLAVSITSSILILMTSVLMHRPLDFTSFPTLLLLTTLLRLALNVATTRTILSHGHEGEQAAGHVVSAFGGFRRGGRDLPWSHDYPRGERNCTRILGELTTIRTRTEESAIVALNDPQLFRYPVAYMAEPGFWRPNDAEAAGLRVQPGWSGPGDTGAAKQ